MAQHSLRIRDEAETETYEPSDAEVEEVLAEFDGDPRRAIKALLQDIEALASDRRGTLAYGYMYQHLELVKLP
ncbi:hypothetical protein E8L99_16135 [Phreatobacter aquaticus]|uniref:Uncharacterized protein n=1 Tax=Phreatobacter aquaticus TaxID=2570229 RepID=A0A4D7QID1_9HYPH|nr:hypothetical protein [Phreatobacter aquaticus]QCK87178.1 hypothetical protein E8L99_16135 [Phreatobacter aquaticus]